MKKDTIILAYFILGWLLGCQPVYVFEPVQRDYFSNLSFDGVQIRVESFYAYESPNMVELSFVIINRDEREIKLSNDIQISGRYLEAHYIDQIAVDDLLTKKVDIVLPHGGSGSFELPYKEFLVQLVCFLNNKSNESFRDIVKKETFTVQLPRVIIDGTIYDFEKIDFVYKRK